MTTQSTSETSASPPLAAPVEPFAHFLSATGHRVLRGAGAYWYDASRGFFLATPSHRQLRPSDEELAALFRHQPCAGLRFAAPLDGPGKLSYQIVCDVRDYGLDVLSGNVRSKVRRGLRRCEITPVTWATIAAHGITADRETLARQQRSVRLVGPAWDAYWAAAAASSTMEAWGAFVGGELAAFLITVLVDDSVEFLLARSRTDSLEAYPNNALVFEVARRMLVERGLRQITFGLESLEDVEALDQFKYGMGFRRAPLRQRVIFHPMLRGILRAASARAAVRRWAGGREGRGGFWHKAVGLLRFAEEGGDLRGARQWAA